MVRIAGVTVDEKILGLGEEVQIGLYDERHPRNYAKVDLVCTA